MATKLDKVLAHLQHVLKPPEGASTDGQLLARFVATRDEDSFAALVRRHGPMVLGVCRRLLRHAQDAEDCFQATFLVLAGRASVVKGEAVGSWLYSVAYRTSLEARALNARRRARERQVEEMPHPEVGPVDIPDWRPWLDQELNRLPEKYRTPVILCDLEGRTRREVAQQLSLPEGTISSRLATARRMLAKRLARYGLPLSGGVLALCCSDAATAGVPESLVVSTTKAAIVVAAGKTAATGFVSATAVTLTEGVLQTMFIAKLKAATVVLFGVAALGLGTGGLVYQTRAGAADAGQADQALVTRSGAEEAQQERDRAKRAAEDARDRERALREELEKARREAEAARAEALEQRRRAEAERKAAEDAVRALKEQLEAARRKVEQVHFVNEVRLAEGEFKKRAEPTRRADNTDRRKALAEIEEMSARISEQFEQQRRALQEQLKKLERDRDEQFTKLKRQAEMLQRQDAPQPKSGSGPAPSDGDKLDKILQRLEQMEKRLDRLERRKE